MDTLLRIDEQIMNSDDIICRFLDGIGYFSVEETSQHILSQLRHFVEHIILKIYAKGEDIEDNQDNVKKSVSFIKGQAKYRFLSKFHSFLQVSVSHRALEKENANRIMIKYYEYLLKVRKLLHEEYSMDVLHNLEKFPIETDETYKEYYEKIAERIEQYNIPAKNEFRVEKFYIQYIKPFFVNGKVYYEVAFVSAKDNASKTDRIIAFTDMEISDYYAVKLAIADSSIQIFGTTMPIRVIVNWEVSIRTCEFKNFAKIIDRDVDNLSEKEQRKICQYLTRTRINLTELLDFSDEDFRILRNEIVPKFNIRYFFDILDECRSFQRLNKPGANILRYLLLHMRNRIIKNQINVLRLWEAQRQCFVNIKVENPKLSNLYLDNKCIPFDQMPFCSSLIRHVPSLSDIFECFDITGREHELLAWIIRNNTEQKGVLFTPLEKSEEHGRHKYRDFENVESLVNYYNSKLYDNPTQQGRKLVIKDDYIFIESYKEDTVSIIKTIKKLTTCGVENYSNAASHWVEKNDKINVSEEKKKALINMFDKSKVALIRGAAGTGKTTHIDYISTYLKDHSRLYLAHTKPAVNNLKRKVSASSKCEFMTISKFINRKAKIKRDYDIVIIDECSTVNNRNMKALLELAEYELLILVGDEYQIEAIEFGNWFNAAKYFMPDSSVFELKELYRSDSKQLRDLWDKVRKMSVQEPDNDILDRLQGGAFSTDLNPSILKPAEENEIILCLNYGGLYGVNNINHFMQENNTGKEIYRDIQRYKVGDPILFNDAADSFFRNNTDDVPVIYNNMKATIVDFRIVNEGNANEVMQFDVALDEPIIELKMEDQNFEIIGKNQKGNTIIRFDVYKNKGSDYDDDINSRAVVPFQLAYAVSIHKAQGLEYDSVKIIITDDIEDKITHNIFYTAITRAKKRLKIYWHKDVERKILERISPIDNRKDVALLKNEIEGNPQP